MVLYPKILEKRHPLKMPKSESQLNSQIATARRNMREIFNELLDECGQNFSFNFNLNDFMEDVTNVDVKSTQEALGKSVYVLQQCLKMVELEEKRRGYIDELNKKLETKEARVVRKMLAKKRTAESESTMVGIKKQKSVQ